MKREPHALTKSGKTLGVRSFYRTLKDFGWGMFHFTFLTVIVIVGLFRCKEKNIQGSGPDADPYQNAAYP